MLPREFFDRPALAVAPGLLGCVITSETADGLVAVELTEVEAYAGEADPASHAYRGRTARNAVMFGPPGHAYVYFTYGMHFCVNLVCLPEGTASAVLARAGRVVAGEDLARARRAPRARLLGERPLGEGPLGERPLPFRDLARGPARLCQALGIDRALDGADVCHPGSPLRVSRGEQAGAVTIGQGPRTGVSQGHEVPWRFWVTGDPTVSPYRRHIPRRRVPSAD